jgi:uncharacterized C2H2 Zn-finger protein
MQIIAYKCPDTGEIFEWKRDYDRHRRKYLAEQRKKENHQRVLQAFADKLAKFRDTAQTPYDIEIWIVANSKFLVHRHSFVNYRKKMNFKFTSVNISVRYDPSVGNTHSAPFNGIENWSREKHLPMGYPGWHGRVEFKYDGDVDGFFSDLFRKTGIYLGTGSGGSGRYGSEIILWEADWPGLRGKRMLDILSKNN